VTVAEMQDALADQISEQLCGTANPVIPSLQVGGRMHPAPTPPSVDIYPGSPFTEAIAYGHGARQYWFTVRARVGTPDNEAAQDLLLAMMDDGSDESVEAAIRSLSSYAGAKLGNIEGPSEFGVFADAGPEGSLLGCTWRVALIP
jgi:hypothetical protein